MTETVKITKTRFDKERGTIYYKIEGLSNWELRTLYNLLRAEKARSEIVRGFNKSPQELATVLETFFTEYDKITEES